MEENKDLKDELQKAKNWTVYSQMGMQMAITIGLGTWLGYWLDGKFEHKMPILTIIFSLVFIGVALYNMIRQIPKE